MKYQTLKIFRPMLGKNITQGWSENRACLRSNGTIYGIAKGQQCPGESFYQSIGMKGHNGLDIAAFVGEDIYHAATFPGWWSTEVDSAGGIGVDVVSNEPLFFPMPIPTELIRTAVPHNQDGVQGFTHHVKMRYWHLYAPVGHNKKAITCGMVVGLAGNTGASSGAHLHFAPKWCLADGTAVGNNNGYFGAFDPSPYYTHETTAKEHMAYMNEKVVPLTPVERKDALESLTAARRLLLALQKLIG